MVSMELTIISLALPSIRDALTGTTPATLSWVVNAYSIVVAALLLLSGWLADHYGRGRVFCTGLAVFTLGSLAAGASSSITMLIAARALQAIGGSMQYPAGMALLLAAFPRGRHQTAIGIWGAMGGLAAAIGPSLGALLIQAFNWRAVFFVNVPVAIAALIVGRRVLTDSQAESDAKAGPGGKGGPGGSGVSDGEGVSMDRGGVGDRGTGRDSRVDVVGVPLASFGVGIVILGIVQGETWGWTSAATIVAFVLGAAMIAAFAARSLRHPAPLFDLGLLRLRSYSLGNLGSLFFSMAFFSLLVPLPSFIQDVWGWSVMSTGLALAVGPSVSFLVSPQAGRIADRVGNSPILSVGAVCGAAGMLWLLAVITEEPSLWRLLVGMVLVGVAAGTGFAQLVGAALRDVPSQRFAMATAGRTTFFQLSVALAIAVSFTIIGSPDNPADALGVYKIVWTMCALGYICNLVVFGVAYPRNRLKSTA